MAGQFINTNHVIKSTLSQINDNTKTPYEKIVKQLKDEVGAHQETARELFLLKQKLREHDETLELLKEKDHDPHSKICKNCNKFSGAGVKGECRYLPPVKVNNGWSFPIMESDMWCAQWSHRDTKQGKAKDIK